MLQLVVNSRLLRELNEDKFVRAYAKLCCREDGDLEDDEIIKLNLEKLLDWESSGTNGLGLYSGKFEKLKKRDMKKLISLIKFHAPRIRDLAEPFIEEDRLEVNKVVKTKQELLHEYYKTKYNDSNYVAGRHSKPCVYHGRVYSSRKECMYREGIHQSRLYRYLERTGQV